MMTKREAIRECKRMWKEIVKSGLSKRDFLYETADGKEWLDKRYHSNCPLCEYIWAKDEDSKNWQCRRYCPLYLQYKPVRQDSWGYCFVMGYPDNPKGFYEYVRGLKE